MKAAVSKWHFWNKNGAKGALTLQGTVFRNEEQNVQTQLVNAIL